MAGQPMSKADLLGRRMMEFVDKDQATDFEVAQLRREATSLLETHADVAHMVLGYLAALEGEESETKSHFRIATKLSHNHAVYVNYSQALYRLNLYSEAVLEARRAYQLALSNVFALDNLIGLCAYAGLVREANSLVGARNQLQASAPIGHEQFLSAASDLMVENNVADSDVEALQEIATSVLRKSGKLARRAEFLIQEDEEDRWASIWLNVRGTVEQVVELNTEFAERLAVIEPPPHADRTVGYMFVTAADRS